MASSSTTSKIAIAFLLAALSWPCQPLHEPLRAQQAIAVDSAGKRIDLKGIRARISLDLTGATLQQSLYAITRASGVRFIYRNETLPADVRVTLSEKSIVAEDALRKVLMGTMLEARAAGYGQMLIVESSVARQPARPRSDTTRRLALSKTPSVLREVVVTGTIVSTARKEIPNPIIVLNQKELAARGVRTIDQLFRGEVAGIIAHDVGSDGNAIGANTLQVRGASGFTALNAPLKTYVDGIEMSDPTFINHIDARTIERVEIVLGPQASTLYGSAAISGVMQLFTKRSYTGERSIVANISGGAMRSKYQGSTAPIHDHSISVAGGKQSLSYNAGVGYVFDGAYAPNSQMRNTSLFAATRAQKSTLQVEATGRYNRRSFGRSQSQFYAQGIVSGRLAYNPYRIVPYQHPGEIEQRLIGTSLRWLTTPSLQQSLTLGQDEQITDFRFSPRRVVSADSTLHLSHGGGARRTAAYNATMERYLYDRLRATATVGADYWLYTYRSNYSGAFAIGDSLVEFHAPYGNKQYNTGYFAQVKTGFDDKLFVTAGLRAEDNPNFPADHGIDFSPRIGLSYVHDLSSSSIKLRGSYGRATRPPCTGCKEGSVTPYSLILPNPALQPETQVGADVGVELYRSGASLQLTYFNQTASGFIYARRVSGPTEDPILYQNQNSGRVKNTGLEAEASWQLAPITLSGNVVLTNATINELAPGYVGGLRVGDQALFVARSSGALGVRYSRNKLGVSLGATYIGRYRDFDDERWAQIELNRFNPSSIGSATLQPDDAFIRYLPGRVRLNLGVTYDPHGWLGTYLRTENLTDVYPPNVNHHTFGRKVVAGVRLGR